MPSSCCVLKPLEEFLKKGGRLEYKKIPGGVGRKFCCIPKDPMNPIHHGKNLADLSEKLKGNNNE